MLYKTEIHEFVLRRRKEGGRERRKERTEGRKKRRKKKEQGRKKEKKEKSKEKFFFTVEGKIL